MKFSPSEFWEMTLHEARLVIQGDRDRQESDLYLFFYANLNAIASCLGKNHKFINPYKKKEHSKEVKKPTAKELKVKLDDLINNWR